MPNFTWPGGTNEGGVALGPGVKTRLGGTVGTTVGVVPVFGKRSMKSGVPLYQVILGDAFESVTNCSAIKTGALATTISILPTSLISPL